MIINIDESAGFCWGVVKTIESVEKDLKEKPGRDIYVLGQIIHNPREIERLENKGLQTIEHTNLGSLDKKDVDVIIRAHGEPPETYNNLKKLGVTTIDATCPLVKNLQKRVKKYYEEGWKIVIFGKREHAEVIGLRGVCNDECIVVRSVDEALENVDCNKKTVLFSQTTMDKRTFYKIKEALERKFEEKCKGNCENMFTAKDTICQFVYGREEKLKNFAENHDIVLFVAGRKSSNGKSLYNVCKSVNNNTYFIENYEEIDTYWFKNAEKIGISGATSTPQWYMEKVKRKLESFFDSDETSMIQ